MSELETRQLRYFVAVAEELHFGRAAERLGTAQPPLSKAIRGLERQLGVQLLARTTRQVRLTPAGQTLLADARAFFTLESNGTLRRVALDGFRQEKRLDLNQECSWLAPSAEGLVVTLSGLGEVWVIDPDQLAVKKLLGKAKDERTRRLIETDLERAREREKE